ESHHAGREQRIPDGEAVFVLHVKLPALLADIGDAEGGHVLTGDLDRLDRGEGEALVGQAVRVLDHFLQRDARVWAPDADGDVFLAHVGDGDAEAFVLRDPLHVAQVARAGVGAVAHAAAIVHAEPGEVRAHRAL